MDRASDWWKRKAYIEEGMTEAITSACAQARGEERERCVEAIKALDPLAALADWDDTESIVTGVQKQCVDAIRAPGRSPGDQGIPPGVPRRAEDGGGVG
jgi:hypothetical protein